jgi:hypothetical protein
MMDELVVPLALAGLDVHRDDAFAEQVIARAIDAHLVAGRQLDTQIGQAQFLVGADLRPVAGVAGILGAAGLEPGVVTELALQRDGVEDPKPLARLHVEAAHIALGVLAHLGGVAGGMRRADNDDIARDGGRGVQPDIGAVEIQVLVVILLEIDDAIGAEAGVHVAGRRIQRHHPVADGDIDDPLHCAVGPIADAAPRKLARRIGGAGAFVHAVDPDQFAIGGIDADHVAARPGGAIEPALDQQRRALKNEFGAPAQIVGLELPGHFQLVEVGGIDLVQRLVAVIGEIAAIAGPVGISGHGLRTALFGNEGKRRGGDARSGGGQHQTAGEGAHVKILENFLLRTVFAVCRSATTLT